MTVIKTPDGKSWKPATSSDIVACINCGNTVDTPVELRSYPDGQCPNCGVGWTGEERRSTTVVVTAPEPAQGEA